MKRTSLEIMEEALSLLRNAPGSALLCYLIGALPFSLAVLFFLSDMSLNAFAQENLALESLGVALLFVWKRIWQGAFAAQLHERLAGGGFSKRNLARLVALQCIWQPLRLVALPMTLLMTIPFAPTVAFFRNIGLFAATGDPDPVAAARRQAGLWPRQNWGILGLALGAGLLLFLNVMVLVVLLPQLARMFLGIEGEWTRAGRALLNTTTMSVALSLAWLALDPLLETAYVLRCFYGASITTGEDLRSLLRKAIPAALLLIGLIGGTPAAKAQSTTPSIDSARLDQSIEEVIRRREFTWRMPRPEGPETERHWPGWLQGLSRAINNAFDWVSKKWKEWFESKPKTSEPVQKAGGRPLIEIWSVLVVLALLVGGILLFLRRNKQKPAEVTPVDVVTAVNLADESVTADQMPESSWLALAEEWLAKGDYRLAMRALYLAGLNYLNGLGLISIVASKTGSEYRRELERRARAAAVPQQVAQTFQGNNLLFERGWYGNHPVDRQQVETFAAGLNEMRRYAQAQ